MYTNKYSLIKDSIEVEKVIERRSRTQKLSREYIQKLIFAKSTVELVEVKGKFIDYSIHNYKSCAAKMNKDTVELAIRYDHKYSGRFPMEGRSIYIKYWPKDFKSEIVHYSDVIVAGRKFPRSKIYFDYLELNKEIYEKGDTICGKISIRATIGKDKTQMIKGNFKSVIF